MSNTFSIVRVFDAVKEEVYDMWTNSEEVKKWWGPKEFTCPDAMLDVRVGGKYLMSMLGPDGKKYWSTGEYKEVVKNEKFVMTDNFSNENGDIVSPDEAGMPGDWGDIMQITVVLEDNVEQGKTTMILTHEGVPLDMQNDCQNSWEQSFDKLDVALTN